MVEDEHQDEGDDGEDQSIFVPTRYERSGTGLEFDRVANFADAIYAISLTLVGIEVPRLADKSSSRELLEQLNDLLPNIVTFFIVFLVVGNYWITHHRYMGWLSAVDRSLMGLQLVYLAIIAFLPFPAALLGVTDGESLGVLHLRAVVGAASLLETLMIGHPHRAQLMRARLSEPASRWARLASFSAVAAFAISIPFAFISLWLGFAIWFANWPIGIVMNRRRPLEFGGPSQSRRR